jgi:hypothetical protein
MATTLSGKELAEELQAASRSRALHTPMEQVIEAAAAQALTDDQYFRLVGQLWAMKRMYYYVYGAWGSSLTINQYPPSVDYLFAKQVYDESTLLTVSIPEQEKYLDLLRMRARQLWDEVKHGSLHADVLIRGGQGQRETELVDELRANYAGSRAYFGLTATFPHIHPLARVAQNYHTEAGVCLGIRCTLEVNKNPLAIHENLSQYYEELMHFMEGKYQMDMFCLTAEDQKPVEEALDFLLWPVFVNSRGLVPED